MAGKFKHERYCDAAKFVLCGEFRVPFRDAHRAPLARVVVVAATEL